MKCLLSPATLHFTHHKGGTFTSTHFSRYLWLSTLSSTHINLTDIVSTVTEKRELWVKCSKFFALCTTFFFLEYCSHSKVATKNILSAPYHHEVYLCGLFLLSAVLLFLPFQAAGRPSYLLSVP